MLRCALELGPNPWPRLEEGRMEGRFARDGEDPIPALVRIRGAHSRKFPKKSLQVDFPASRLRDEPPTGHSVRRLHLNADFIDPTLMRSALSFWLFDRMGLPAPRFRHVALTVSGETAGIYIALESVDKDFCRRRGWEQGPIYYAINRNANFDLLSAFSKALKHPLDQGYRPVQRADTTELCKLLTEINLASDRHFPAVAERRLDVDGYLGWLMVAVFVGNRDGFLHNYALYCEPSTMRFRIIPWDYDATWGIDIHGRGARLDRVPVTGWNKLTGRLMSVPAIRRRYRERFLAALDGPMAPDTIGAQIDTMAAEIGPEIDKSPRLSSRFLADIPTLRWWAEHRRRLLLSELAAL